MSGRLVRPFGILTLAIVCVVISPDRLTAEEPEFGGRSLSAWNTMLKEDTVPRKRRAALVALGQIAVQTDNNDTDKLIVAIFSKTLRTDASPIVRRQAAVLIGQQRLEYALGTLTDLTEAMRSEQDAEIRREVAAILAGFGPLAKPAIVPLTQALHDSDAGVRTAAANALGRIGADARTATAELMAKTKDPELSVRLAAVFALGRIEPEDTATVASAILAVLNAEKNAATRREVLQALRFLGDRSEEVVQAVANCLKDDDVELRREAVIVLGKFGSSVRSVPQPIEKAFTDDADTLVRTYAVRLIRHLHQDHSDAFISALGQRLTGAQADPEPEVRMAICEELGSLGAAGKAAIPLLREARRDPQLKVREAATAALRQIEKPPAPASSPRPQP
ncbi:MAG: HEAT repeat domain-containing protein [Bacteroidales bacterium]|nr:HEAT repeat domain-containing protein [Bacteroidales bacterium]